jgi:CBS domain containing-hemolysin-like protein
VHHLFKPIVWFYSRITDALFRLLACRTSATKITSDDILAMTEAGARAGVLARREQQVIANVFELDSRTVSSAMTQRDRIAYFLRDDPDPVIRARIAESPTPPTRYAMAISTMWWAMWMPRTCSSAR